MKKFLAALALLLGLSTAAHAYTLSQATLNANLDAQTNGFPLNTQANIAAIFTDGTANYNFEDQGTNASVSVVTNGTNSGSCSTVTTSHKCFETIVPAGYGPGRNAGTPAGYVGLGFRLTTGAVTTTTDKVVTIEFDQFYETGYDLHPYQKVPISLGVWDAAANNWQRMQINLQCTGSYTTTCSTGHTQFVNYLQNDANGGHDNCTSTFMGSGAPGYVATNQWYHVKIQSDVTTASAPTFKVWEGPNGGTQTQTMNCTWTPPAGSVTAAHNYLVMFQFWFGGAGSNDKPNVDTYALTANLQVYTGTAPGGDVTPPSVPTGLFAATQGLLPDQASCQVKDTWNASTDDSSVASYNVKRDGSVVFSGNALTYTDTVTCGNTYSYTVNACDAVPNCSAYSSASSITMLDTTPPSVPAGLAAAVISSSRIDPSWSASTNLFGHPTTYHVRRDGSIVCTTTSLTCSDTGLTSSHQYSYTVDASDAAVGGPNISAQSSAVLATTSGGGGDVTAPSTPGSFHVVSVGANFISYAWTASTDDTAVADYRVTCGGALVATVAATTYLYNNLTPLTSYTCSVQAIDAVPNVSTKTADVVQVTKDNTNFLILTPQALSGSFSTGP